MSKYRITRIEKGGCWHVCSEIDYLALECGDCRQSTEEIEITHLDYRPEYTEINTYNSFNPVHRVMSGYRCTDCQKLLSDKDVQRIREYWEAKTAEKEASNARRR